MQAPLELIIFINVFFKLEPLNVEAPQSLDIFPEEGKCMAFPSLPPVLLSPVIAYIDQV